MKNAIVDDGELRLAKGRNAKYLQEARAKYADEWGKASFMRKFWLRYKIWSESTHRRPEDHQPSPRTLW